MAYNNKERQFWTERLSGKGRLGADPKLITNSNSSISIAVARVAASSRTNDRNGDPQDRTVWRNLKFFGYTADQVMDNLKKGSYINYEGRVNPSSYINKDGDEVPTEEILVDKIGLELPYNKDDSTPSRKKSSGNRKRRREEVEDDYDDEGYDDDGDIDALIGEEEEEKPKRSRSRSRSRSGGKSRSRSSQTADIDDDVEDYEEGLF